MRSRSYGTTLRTHAAAGETNVPLNAKAIMGVEHEFTLTYKSLILESWGRIKRMLIEQTLLYRKKTVLFPLRSK